MTRPFDLEDAISCSLEFVGCTFVAGLVVTPVLMAILQSAGAIVVVLLHNFLAMFFLFPGAILLNFALIRRYGPARQPRTWAAAFLTVVVGWVGYALIAAVPIPPASVLQRLAGTGGAWVVHLGGWMIVASTVGQICGWSLCGGSADRMKS
jgi:hypothetical protein